MSRLTVCALLIVAIATAASLTAWHEAPAAVVAVGPPPVARVADSRVTPVADTWIEVPYPPGIGQTPNATPQGAAKTLHSGWWDYGINERTLMRFAVPTLMPDFQVGRAELELAVVYAGIGTFDPPPVVTGTMHLILAAVAAPWDEATLTGRDGVQTAFPVVTADVPFGPCVPNDCGTARLDVRPLVAAWSMYPPGNYGLVLDARGVINRPSTGASFVVASRESSRPPVLSLSFESSWPTATPRPTSSSRPSATPTATVDRPPPPTRTPPRPTPVVSRLWLPDVAVSPVRSR